MYIYIHIYIYIYLYVYVCICTYIYIYTYIFKHWERYLYTPPKCYEASKKCECDKCQAVYTKDQLVFRKMTRTKKSHDTRSKESCPSDVTGNLFSVCSVWEMLQEVPVSIKWCEGGVPLTNSLMTKWPMDDVLLSVCFFTMCNDTTGTSFRCTHSVFLCYFHKF